MLLVQPRGTHSWSLPGGTIEPGEAPDAACTREVHEETRLQLPVLDLLFSGYTQPHEPGWPGTITFLFDLGRWDAAMLGRQVMLQSAELDDWRWCPDGDVLDSLLPAQAHRLRAWQLGLRYGTQTALGNPSSS
ncbi:8-oxo-dGTP pyrophosphatase MutT (NUDIX family) [Kutzneria viridogrisea]|uniref:8-oxo-dGTP pyrophosphatase MutT (NUDIX family) n=1 Tax=Kutzneria viridogrisea TaxID=47990 RepID=A0ABR6BRE1_9PSEU|nr:8-oxo-dGTP pyrophosphatase MutT (NUDIX family) [Kutzneria viridogrisea]